MPAQPAKPACFKAYDIRGKFPQDIDLDLAYRIGRVTVTHTDGRRFVVGRDCRLSSESISAALVHGLTDSGADVLDIGLCGTEMVYYATFDREFDGGVMITASHNPRDFNGMKLVREEARPISGDSGLDEIGARVLDLDLAITGRAGTKNHEDLTDPFVEFLLAQVATDRLAPLKIVANPGNGCAGPLLTKIAAKLPCEFVLINAEPDGNFPNGVPNPLLPENRSATAAAVCEHRADFGLAWDGDYDRCFFFDEHGQFVEGYYLVGLLAEITLRGRPGAAIVHDPRLIWNTIDIVERAGGRAVMNKTGHAFMKERMRVEDAAYGGEMSAHHYFRRFAYCDSGMLPWLLVLQEISTSGKSLSQLVAAMQRAYPVSGEINRRLPNPAAALDRVEAAYAPEAVAVDRTDGLSLAMPRWRFNVRQSNTEPVVRLNVESRGDAGLVQEKTTEILALLES